jgi:hypothetical protein
MVEIVASWERDGSNGAAHPQWAPNPWEGLAAIALPGGSANLLGPDDREQAAGAYGDNAARLRALKRRFDRQPYANGPNAIDALHPSSWSLKRSMPIEFSQSRARR